MSLRFRNKMSWEFYLSEKKGFHMVRTNIISLLFRGVNTMLPSVVCFVSSRTTMHTSKVFIETVKYQLV